MVTVVEEANVNVPLATCSGGVGEAYWNDNLPELASTLPLSVAVELLLPRVWLAPSVNVERREDTSKTAPAAMLMFVEVAMEAPPVNASVPPLMMVLPVKVLTFVSVRVPAPILVKPPPAPPVPFNNAA